MGVLPATLALENLEIGPQELDGEARVTKIAQLACFVGEAHLLVAEADQADDHLVGQVEGMHTLELVAHRAGALFVARRRPLLVLLSHADPPACQRFWRLTWHAPGAPFRRTPRATSRPSNEPSQ